MVRINIINVKNLADQHLIAEYNEILILFGYVKKNPELDLSRVPEEYVLGEGHILFFKNKLRYLKNRHEEIKSEMKKRGFKTRISINLNKFNKNLHGNWKAKIKDKEIIKERLVWKVIKKPKYYRYYGERKTKDFFLEMIKNAR